MSISADIFTRCSPGIGTSLNSCGSVTACDVVSATPSQLTSIFTDGSGNFRDMQSLIGVQFEMKACGARTNGLFDLLMANKQNMRAYLNKKSVKGSDSIIEPFIMAGQKSVINDEYWAITANASGAGGTRNITVVSRNNAALDASYFPTSSRIFCFSTSGGGSAIRTAYKVNSASVSGSTIVINATSEDSGTFLTGAKVGNPSTGFLVRGTPNINDVERWCENRPALNPNKNIPFWFETNRWSMCVDSMYEEYLLEMTKKNPYFARFGDVPVAERNRQYSAMFQKEWVNQFFWGKPLANQTLANYRSLEQIQTYGSSPLYLNSSEGRCVGFRANAIGVYEQLAQCGRVKDCQGQQLNLQELFNELYRIMRSRGDQGKPSDKNIDIFTDSMTAARIQQAMILYYNNQLGGAARYNFDLSGFATSGRNNTLGFDYTSYKLIYPQGVTINIITNFFFDDFATAAGRENLQSTGRFLWVLDFSGIYAGIIASNRIVHRTGDIRELAKVDSAYACVMENPTQEVSLNSITWTAVVECPSDHLILEGFSDAVPEYRGISGDAYDIYGTY